jgi:hypothetical protein
MRASSASSLFPALEPGVPSKDAPRQGQGRPKRLPQLVLSPPMLLARLARYTPHRPTHLPYHCNNLPSVPLHAGRANASPNLPGRATTDEPKVPGLVQLPLAFAPRQFPPHTLSRNKGSPFGRATRSTLPAPDRSPGYQEGARQHANSCGRPGPMLFHTRVGLTRQPPPPAILQSCWTPVGHSRLVRPIPGYVPISVPHRGRPLQESRPFLRQPAPTSVRYVAGCHPCKVLRPWFHVARLRGRQLPRQSRVHLVAVFYGGLAMPHACAGRATP